MSKLSRGGCFGEITANDEQKRTASARAVSERVVCASIDRWTYTAMVGTFISFQNQLKFVQPSSNPSRVTSFASSNVRGAPARLHFDAWVVRARRRADQAAAASRRAPFGSHRAGCAFTGRRSERELIASQIELVLAARMPSVTIITGETGMGKSHMLLELRNFYYNISPLMYIKAQQDVELSGDVRFDSLRRTPHPILHRSL